MESLTPTEQKIIEMACLICGEHAEQNLIPVGLKTLISERLPEVSAEEIRIAMKKQRHNWREERTVKPRF